MFDTLKFKNLKIGQKLVVILLFVSLIPLLAISVSNYFYAKTELEKKTIASLDAITSSRADYINHAIRLKQEQAKAFAGAYLARQLRESGLNDRAVVLGIQEDIDSIYRDLHLSPSSNYKDIDKKTDIDIIGVWDVLGNIIANTNRSLIGKKMPIEYMQNVYKQGTYFGGFQKDPLTGKNYLILLEEIRSWKNNRIVGAISLKISAKIINDITTVREGLGKSGETYIVNKQYLMITPSRFIKNSVLNTRVITEGTQACFAKKPAPMIYKNYRGIDVLGVQRYLPDQDWCLVSEIDAREALAPVRALRNRTLAIGTVLIVLILTVIYLVSHIMIRPILKLHDASQEIKRGNYDIRLDVYGKDEISELSKAFNEMTQALAEATNELQQKSQELFKNFALSTQQKKELKKVNEELDRFVYTASHDLRAPLRGISSFASFLEEDYKNKLDKTGKEYIDEIKKGASKMNAFIEDLLLLSRISRIKNPYENVDIAALLDAVLDRLKFDISKNHVKIQKPESVPLVFCDRIKMTEVFFNLINNAIKFSSKDNKEDPSVEIGYQDRPDVHEFFVKDNGIGIDPQYHEQIFAIFKRLHTDKEYEGTGAGLSIIKRVIEDHQGRIWVESTPGAGATFLFTIPKNLRNEQDGSPENA